MKQNFTIFKKPPTIDKVIGMICMLVIIAGMPIQSQAQCGFAAGLGCAETDYENFGMNSNTNAKSISYDNFVSSFHATSVRNMDGGFQIWGQLNWVNNNDNSSTNYFFRSPTKINSTNFPGISGVVLMTTIGSRDGYGAQLFILTTDGLYVTGSENAVITNNLTTGSRTVDEISIPSGVSYVGIKSLFATTHSLGLLTCDGAVYVLSQENNMRGRNSGSGGSASTWYRVKKADGTDLTNIIALRGNPYSFFALDENGALWTWGLRTYLGDGSGVSTSRNAATQMALPKSGNIKMIGATGHNGNAADWTTTSSTWHTSYYVLYGDGSIYSLGDNDLNQLGDWTTANRTSWVRPRYNSTSGAFINDIHWIAPQEHDMRYSFINTLTKDSTLVNWGGESGYDLGRSAQGSTGSVTGVNPEAVNDANFPIGQKNEKIVAVSSGGHTTMIQQMCQDNFGYVGHKIHGSMGDSTGVDANGQETFTFSTAAVLVCGSVTKPSLNVSFNYSSPTGEACSGQSAVITARPEGGILEVVSTNGGIANLDGNILTFDGSSGDVTIRYTDPTFPCFPNYKDTTISFVECNLNKIKGKVWVDNSLDAVLDVNEYGTNAQNSSFGGLWANLVGTDGKVIVSVPVNADGSYSVPVPSNGTYAIQITNAQSGVGVAIGSSSNTLPSGWTYTGNNKNNSNVCLAPGCANPYNISGIVISGADINGINFGIVLDSTNLPITKESDVDDKYSAGDTITYTIVVKNDDDFRHTHVSVTDTLPAGVSYVPNSVQAYVTNPIPGQPAQTITTSPIGTGSFNVPSGISKIVVETWGAGGKGGTRTSSGRTGGGGGGAYSRDTILVSQSTYYYSVGTGSNNTSPGEDTWFATTNSSSTAIVLAKGGESVSNNNTTGANGGSATAGIGQFKYSGGNGGSANGSTPGGGGSSAGNTSAGANGSVGAGGIAPNGGGNGGDANGNNANGNPGLIPGGGGSGVSRSNGTRIGGAGADGKIIISYTIPAISSDGTIGIPPLLADNWTIRPNDSLVVTFKVVVNSPLNVDSIKNTAFVRSTYLQQPNEDSVTDYATKNTTNAVNDENSTWVNTPVSGGVMTNDFDREGDSQSFSSFLNQDNSGNPMTSGATVSGIDSDGNPVANAGSLTFNPDGTYTFTPSNGFVGNVSVPYAIHDNGNPAGDAVDTAVLTITVSPLPTDANSVIANNDEYVTQGTTPVNSNILTNDADPQGDGFTVTEITYTDASGVQQTIDPSTIGSPITVSGINDNGQTVPAGTFTLDEHGQLVFTPNGTFSGTVPMHYEITDDYTSEPATDNADINIRVTLDQNGPQNDPPFAGDDFSTTTVNVPVTGNFVNNDSDPNGDPISMKDSTGTPVTIVPGKSNPQPINTVTTVQGGTVTFYDDGSYQYTPPTDYVGPDELTNPYQICDVTNVDPQPLCAEANVHLLVGNGLNIQGTILNDGNGMNDDYVNGDSTNADNQLYAVLTDASGNVIKSTPIAADGSYEFNNLPFGTDFKVLLDTTARNSGEVVTSSTLPQGWVSTGEIIGQVQGDDGNINGQSVDFRPRTHVEHINFGLNQLPQADAKDYVVDHGDFTVSNGLPDFSHQGENYYYLPTSSLALTNVSYPYNGLLTGSDPEDCAAAQSCNSAANFIVNAIYPTTVLFYHFPGESGVRRVVVGDTIANYDPANLLIYAVEGSGLEDTISNPSGGPIGFQYSILDNAGFASAPVDYRILTDNALPIELIYFTAKLDDCTVDLDWATASELNNDYFEVQRSSDARTWTTVGKVQGSGNSNVRKEYSYKDEVEWSGTIYYRLVQTDYDGTTEIHKTVSVQANCGIQGVAIYPNPTRNTLNVEVGQLSMERTKLTILDATGRLIRTVIAQPLSRQQLDVSSLPSGIYYMQVTTNSASKTLPFIVTK